MSLLWFGTRSARIILIGVIVLALIGLRAGDVSNQRKIGANKVVSDINNKTQVINEKARRARRNARKPGARGRVQKKYCRDC